MNHYKVVWRHICEDVLLVNAKTPEEALQKTINGYGETDGSYPVESLSYVVYSDDAKSPALLADSNGSELCRVK